MINMQRIKTGSPKAELVELLKASVPTEVAEAFAGRVGVVGVVRRSNDYLYHAVELNSLELVRCLLEMGFSPNTIREHEPPLITAAREGYLPIVETLLGHGAKPNVRGECMETAMLEAASHGHLAVARLLLGAGANADLRDDQDQSPILVAAHHGRVEMVGLLKGYTKKREAKIAESLLNSPLEVTEEGLRLHKAVKDSLPLRTRDEKLKVVRDLLESGVDPNSPNPSGDRPLKSCRLRMDENIADLLLEYGASVDCMDIYGQTVLDWVAYSGDAQVYDRFYALASPETRKQADRIKAKVIKSKQWKE